jgi:hypothetical protein
MKKIILCLTVFLLFFGFKLAYAEVVINEIAWMGSSDNANAEWIELKNTGSNNVDLSGWTLIAEDGTPNILLSEKCTNLIINAGNFLLLERTSDDSVLGVSADCIYAGAMGNTSEFLKLVDGSAHIVDSVDATSGWMAGDNNTKETMQKSGSNWITAVATPKAQNAGISTQNSSNNSNTGTTSSSTQNTDTKIKTAEVSKIKTEIIAKTFAFTGIPLEFKANTTGYNNEQLSYGQYFWNFGDGDSKETKASDIAKFTHTFFYEGEYIVSLEYFQNYYSNNPDAVDEIIIKVVKTDISISNVGDEKDFFVEISNNTNYDTDLSKWILSSNTKSFILPKNTIVQSKKKIILSPKITCFTILDKDSLKLSNSQWETIFDYTSFLNPVKILQGGLGGETPKSALNSKAVPISEEIVSKIPQSGEDMKLGNLKIPSENLGAEAIKGLINNEDSGDNFNYGILGLFVFLSISAGVVYYIRTNNRGIVREGVGSDFKILDE